MIFILTIVSLYKMDVVVIRRIIAESQRNIDNRSCEQLSEYLSFVDTVIEGKKTELFKARMNYICMANSFREVMERDYRCKQICRFLKKYWNYEEKRAKKTADKLNEARRVHMKLEQILNNCDQCNVDIRILTIKELYLASNLSWVMKRKAEVKSKERVPEDAVIHIDHGSVQESFEEILNSRWYIQARENPQLVAIIMNNLTTRVIDDSIFSSR